MYMSTSDMYLACTNLSFWSYECIHACIFLLKLNIMKCFSEVSYRNAPFLESFFLSIYQKGSFKIDVCFNNLLSNETFILKGAWK